MRSVKQTLALSSLRIKIKLLPEGIFMYLCLYFQLCTSFCLPVLFTFKHHESALRSECVLVPLHLTVRWRPRFLVSLMQALVWSVLCAAYRTWRRDSRVERHFSFFLPCLFLKNTTWRVDKIRLPRTRCAKVHHYETWLVLGSPRVSHETEVVDLSSVNDISFQGFP
jgi:hypothetical protein